ncbi:MAG TPA: AtpZ/AtpI family protein [Myxococcota bacterium]
MKSEIDGRAGKAYQRALEAVLAIPIGLGIGYFVDGRLESSPVGLLIGTALGFAAFVRRLVSMRSLVESAPPSTRDGSDSERRD